MLPESQVSLDKLTGLSYNVVFTEGDHWLRLRQTLKIIKNFALAFTKWILLNWTVKTWFGAPRPDERETPTTKITIRKKKKKKNLKRTSICWPPAPCWGLFDRPHISLFPLTLATWVAFLNGRPYSLPILTLEVVKFSPGELAANEAPRPVLLPTQCKPDS